MTDSGGRKVPWRVRNGMGGGTLDKDMLCIGFGEGRRIPAMGGCGAVVA